MSLINFNALADDIVAKSKNQEGQLVSFTFSKDSAKDTVTKQTQQLNEMVKKAQEQLNIIKRIKTKLRFYIILAAIGVGVLFVWISTLTFMTVKLWRKVYK